MKKGQKAAKTTDKTEVTEEVMAAVSPADTPETKEEATAEETKTKASKADAPKEDKKTEPKEDTAKEALKKTAEKKTTVRKTAGKESSDDTVKKEEVSGMEAKVIIQQNGYELEPKLILEKAKADWLSRGHKETELKSIELYIKPEEWAAYYVVNGEMSPENKVSLD